jgi:prepilin-type N-terminal cleavage/methylation domain-containing protein
MKPSKTSGFTLVEVMIVIAILAILTAIAWPYFKTNREEVFRRTCMSNMSRIEHAKAQYAMTSSNPDKELTWEDLKDYIRHKPECPMGGVYDGWRLTTPICCSQHDWKSDPKLAGFIP